jgi:DNA-binding CsgD family transcriptional regulator
VVSYRIDGIAPSHTQAISRTGSQPPRTIADYIAETRTTADEYQHPVAVFDLEGQPVFRNSALAARLTSEQQSPSSDRTWQLVYATACRMVAESIAARSGISTVIPIQQRSFVILGSLLRQTSGTVYGVIVHIAEITGSAREMVPVSARAGSTDTRSADAGDDAYRSWMQRRDEARSRMQRLSPRENEVVARVSAGLPNKSIARELEISVKTIEKHRANAVRKLGIQSTPEMVRIAVLADIEKEATAPVLKPTASQLPKPAHSVQPAYAAGHSTAGGHSTAD